VPLPGLVEGVALAAAQLDGLDRAEWDADLAWDGYRVMVLKRGSYVRFEGLTRRDCAESFTPLRTAVAALPVPHFIAEGFVCVLDDQARPSFERLRAWVRGEKGGRLTLVLCDLLRLDERDVALEPLYQRRALLLSVVPRGHERLLCAEPLDGALTELLMAVRGAGLPGLLLRHRQSPASSAPSFSPASAGQVLLERSAAAAPKVSNAKKVLFPRDGLTKQDLVDYYLAMAPLMVSHLEGRPVVAQRWPDGIDGFTWYQHRAPPRAPDYVRSTQVDADRRLLVDSNECLLWLANQAALTFLTWTTRVGALATPTWVIFDLDPAPNQPWHIVIEVAQALGHLLSLLQLDSVVKTSGQRGLHVLIPLAEGHSFDDVQRFSLRVARVIAQLFPSAVSLEMSKAKRPTALLFDHAQNFRGKTLVAAYSVRGVDGASVSAPIDWAEVTPALDPRAFTVRTVPERVAKLGDLAAKLLRPGTAKLKDALEKLDP